MKLFIPRFRYRTKKRAFIFLVTCMAFYLVLLSLCTVDWNYWTWCFFRTVPNGWLVKTQWEHLRGKRMIDIIKPWLNKPILLQPHKTKENKQDVTDPMRKTPFAVMMVITSPENKERRMWIRNTWYTWKDRYDIQIVFFMGIPGKSKFLLTNHDNNTKEDVQKESVMYQDIVVDDFEEEYFALPIKVLRGMKFYLETYEQTDNTTQQSRQPLPFFIKVDDDVFVNVPNFLRKLKSTSSSFVETSSENLGFIAGHVYPSSVPYYNNWRSKFYIPYDILDSYWFPVYLNGPCYVISGNLVHKMYVRALESEYFPFEDVFITGIVGNLKLGLIPVEIPGIGQYIGEDELTVYDKILANCDVLYTNNMSEKIMIEMFKYHIIKYCVKS